MTDNRDSGDHELIQRVQNGDAGAFRVLVDRHHRNVYVVARQVTGNDDDARDAAQEVFIRLHASLDTVDRRRTFTTWLYRVTVNAAIDIRRRRKKREIPLDQLETEPHDAGQHARPDSASEHSELRGILERIAGGLSDRQRAVFVLRDLQDRTVDEIAGILELRPATVRVHLAAAREHVRGMLMKRYPEYTATFGQQENTP